MMPRKVSIVFVWLTTLAILDVVLASEIDIEIEQIMKANAFENKDGGAWKQGWKVTYDPARWQGDANKLHVFMVPHSHNDPGWLDTFEGYFASKTKGIISSVVDGLNADPDRAFIWAEISFFSMWWEGATEAQRATAKNLLKEGRLEIVTGGWVMNDEATSHLYAIVNQLTEGHEWLRKHVQVKPRVGWSIDPFGHSPTQAYLYARAGFAGTLIQRIHYVLKRELARQQNLEFHWRQLWAAGTGDNSTDMFTHLMPFYSYDIPHTCGPEPRVCAQYEFGRKQTTAWGDRLVPLDEANVREKSEVYLDQFRKKATLYRTHNVLVPLGEDFAYVTPGEFEGMMTPHKRIHAYLNGAQPLNVHIKFSNLSGYFDAVRAEGQRAGIDFPVLSGDFFTYADKDEEYWSGYYTNRPFYKRQCRVLEATVRAAEMMHVLARASGALDAATDQRVFSSLQYGRRMLALFQHHDGITGTARAHVVTDYGEKLHSAKWQLRASMASLTSSLLASSSSSAAPSTPVPSGEFAQAERKESEHDLPRPSLIQLSEAAVGAVVPVVLFNSLTHQRAEVVCVEVDTQHVQVVSMGTGGASKISSVASQLSPVWDNDLSDEPSKTQWRLCFLAEMQGLGLTTFLVEKSEEAHKLAEHFSVSPASQRNVADAEITLSNQHMQAHFTQEGWLTAVSWEAHALDNSNQGEATRERESVRESVQGYAAHGGAYLFLPNGKSASEPGSAGVRIRVVKGPLVQELQRVSQQSAVYSRTARIYNAPGVYADFIELRHYVRLQDSNKELAVRIDTAVASDRLFYTDLNGFQMQRRTRRDDRPIQHNYYPATSAMYIEDSALSLLAPIDDCSGRLSVLTSHSMGVSSLTAGSLEWMLDRRLQNDDARGLGEGLTDNLPTEVISYLVVEPRLYALPDRLGAKGGPALAQTRHSLSYIASRLLASLQHPPQRLYGQAPLPNAAAWLLNHLPSVSLLSPSFPSDLHIISLKERDEDAQEGTLLQLLRLDFDPAFARPEPSQSVSTHTQHLGSKSGGPPTTVLEGPPADLPWDLHAHLLPCAHIATAQEHSLTFMHPHSQVKSGEHVNFSFKDVRAFLLRVEASPTCRRAGMLTDARLPAKTSSLRASPPSSPAATSSSKPPLSSLSSSSRLSAPPARNRTSGRHSSRTATSGVAIVDVNVDAVNVQKHEEGEGSGARLGKGDDVRQQVAELEAERQKVAKERKQLEEQLEVVRQQLRSLSASKPAPVAVPTTYYVTMLILLVLTFLGIYLLQNKRMVVAVLLVLALFANMLLPTFFLYPSLPTNERP